MLVASSQLEVEALGAVSLSTSQQTSALTQVTNLLQPVLNVIDTPLTALFEALGLTLGGADITILSLEPEQPALAR